MSSVMFYGFAAWVGTLTGETTCSLWSADPTTIGWNATQILIDSSATTSAALLGRIPVPAVQIDDYVADGGQTTIGPRWPGGNMIGGCWMAAAWWTKLTKGQPQPLPTRPGGHPYEYTSVQYFENEHGNRRFHGLHARITATQGPLTKVDIWNPGTSLSSPGPAGSWWIDLAASADPGHTQINAGNPAGALYLDTRSLGAITLIGGPKLPPLKGTFSFARLP